MESRATLITGRWYSTTTYDEEPPLPTGEEGLRGRHLDQLEVVDVGTTNGDFKSPNNFSYNKEVVSGWYGTALSRRGGSQLGNQRYTTFSEGWFGVNVNRGLFPEFQQDTYNTALDRLNESLRGQIDLSIDLLQMGDTIKLARQIGSVISQFRALRKGNLEDWYREFKRYEHGSPRSIGSKWLSWVYGIKPTLQTIYDLLQFRLNRVQHVMVVEARATNTGGGSEEEQSLSIDPDHRCKVLWRASDRCHIKVRMRPPETFMQILGNLTSLNPASIAWELTPFSFVVDWVFNVGGYLRALETALTYGSLFLDGFVVRTYLNEGQTTCFSRVSYASDVFNVYELSSSYRRTRYQRSVLYGYPFPRPPVFKVDLSSAQLLNAAALLTQFLPRR